MSEAPLSADLEQMRERAFQNFMRESLSANMNSALNSARTTTDAETNSEYQDDESRNQDAESRNQDAESRNQDDESGNQDDESGNQDGSYSEDTGSLDESSGFEDSESMESCTDFLEGMVNLISEMRNLVTSSPAHEFMDVSRGFSARDKRNNRSRMPQNANEFVESTFGNVDNRANGGVPVTLKGIFTIKGVPTAGTFVGRPVNTDQPQF